MPIKRYKPEQIVTLLNPLAVIRRFRLLRCMLRALPPMKVSSASTSIPGPPSFRKKEPVCMASLIRWSINQAVF